LLNTKFKPFDRLVSQAKKIRLIGTTGQVIQIVRILRPSAESLSPQAKKSRQPCLPGRSEAKAGKSCQKK